MRIAYVINSLEGGGAALPVPDLLEVMRAHGGAPHVFALTKRDGRALAPIRRAGFPVTMREGGGERSSRRLSLAQGADARI